jgi:uncharacterized protein YprB with RNaseH-like and TPR domain
MALDYLRQYAPQSARREPDQMPDTADAPVPVEQIVGASLESVTTGSAVVARSAWPARHRHGLHDLGALAGISGEQLALISLDAELAYADLSRAVFLDTETTGLSTGTGTYVFLVGAGYFDGDQFLVSQFFLRSPGDELPFLEALDGFLGHFSMIVTFNGKAFDWPLLESRFVRRREFRRAPLDDPLHLDLLHPARRMWKRRLESCALSSLEREILQVHRSTQDVPGWLIPSLYFRYLRSGDASGLRGVFYHNLHDILSLATLAIHLHRVVTDPLSGLVTDGIDFYCLGRLHERSGDTVGAEMCYEEALRLGLTSQDRAECLVQLAYCQKRGRSWEAALFTWERLIESGGPSALHGLVERAKYHEHVEHEYLSALDDVQHALQLADVHGITDVDLKELEHRRARLLNRVYRNRSWVGSGG